VPGADQTYHNLVLMIEMGYRSTGRINGGHHGLPLQPKPVN
jgi:hypothetical protein